MPAQHTLNLHALQNQCIRTQNWDKLAQIVPVLMAAEVSVLSDRCAFQQSLLSTMLRLGPW